MPCMPCARLHALKSEYSCVVVSSQKIFLNNFFWPTFSAIMTVFFFSFSLFIWTNFLANFFSNNDSIFISFSGSSTPHQTGPTGWRMNIKRTLLDSSKVSRTILFYWLSDHLSKSFLYVLLTIFVAKMLCTSRQHFGLLSHVVYITTFLINFYLYE